MIACCSITFGQTNEKICVDRDSLYAVFSNFEEVKARFESIKIDTVGYRSIIKKEREKAQAGELIIGNYRDIVVPNQKKQILLMQKEVELEKREGKKKYWRGIRDGGILTILIAGIAIIVSN